MRAKFLLITVLVMVSAFAIGLTGCGGCGGGEKSQPPDKITIELNHYSYQIDMLEDFTFGVTTTAKASDIVWASSDEKVATVSGGKVTPISVGETTITAKAGEETATCYLTVVDNKQLPRLTVSETNLTMIPEDTYKVDVNMTYLSKKCENVQYTFTSLNESVATVNSDGVITAVSKGSTQVIVVAQWKTVDKDYTTEYINIKVVRDISLKFNVNKCSLYAIDSLDGIDYENSKSVTCKPYESDEEIPVDVNFRLEDESICSFDSGVITGKKSGKTRLYASIEYDGFTYSDGIEIDVKHVVVEKNIDFKLSKLNADVSGIFGNGIEATKVVDLSSGKNTEYTVTDGIIDGANAFVAKSTVKLAIYNDRYAYIVSDVQVSDLYLTKPADVEIMRGQAQGYFVLGNDIDMTGAKYGLYEQTFAGEFDGKGHTISNLNYTVNNTSLFYRFQGLMHDIVLKDVKLGGVQGGAVAVFMKGGTLDNVYINLSFGNSNHSGGIAKYAEAGTATVSNCIVNVTSSMTNNSGLLFGFGTTTAVLNLNNTYAIKADTNATLVGARGDSYATFRDEINSMDTEETPLSFTFDGFTNALSAKEIEVESEEMCNVIMGFTAISTKEELLAMRNISGSGKYYYLANDIDLGGATLPLADSAVWSGTFDGKGHTVKNFKIGTADSTYGAGFFKTVGGKVCNVAFTGVKFGAVQGGVVCGILRAGATIDNVYIQANMTNSNASGLICKTLSSNAKDIKITNCVLYATNTTKPSNDGLIISFADSTMANAEAIDITGTYAIKSNSNMTLAGRESGYTTFYNYLNGFDTAETPRSFTLAQFKNADLDFSSYGAAVKDHINAL